MVQIPFIGKARDDPEDKPRRRLTEADFKAGKISQAVFLDACTRASTIFPLTGAGLGLFWTLLIAPSLEALGVTIVAALVGAGSFFYHFGYKGEQHGADRIEELRKQLREQQIADFAEMAGKCTSVGFIDGAQKVRELNDAYNELLVFLKTKQKDLDISHWVILADGTFKQGADLIAHALEVYEAIDSVDDAKLTKEMNGWKRELAKLDATGSRAQTLQTGIEDHNKRLVEFGKKKEQLEQLLINAGAIIDGLASSRVTMTDMGHSMSASSVLSENGGAYSMLKASVDATVKAEARIRGDLSDEERAQNAKYLKAGSGGGGYRISE